MPSARPRRDSGHAGGTSIAPELARGGCTVWIVGGLVVIAGVVAATVTLTGGPRPPAGEVGPDRGSELVPVAVTAPVEPLPPPIAPPRLDPLGAADRLERVLATQRLFAKTTLHLEGIELRSEFCADARLRAVVTAAVEDLRAQGLLTVRCVALHGADVFTQPL